MAQQKLKCCVQHCNIKFGDFDEDRNPYKFFQFPPLRKYKNSDLTKLSTKRRKAWKQVLKISNPAVINKSTICSNHFINKKPALLKDEEDPDWVPNLNLELCKTVKLKIDKYHDEDLSSNTSISEDNIKMEEDIEMTEYKFADESASVEETFQCRLCSEHVDSTKMLSLFSDEMWFGMNLLKSIDYVLSLRIKHNDDLPDTICTTCATQVVEFHKFKEKCRNVYENFSKSSERRDPTETDPNLYSNLKALEEITDNNDTFIACRFKNTTCDIENAKTFSEIQSKDKITTIITCNLRTKEDLENLIIMENKLILLKYQKYGELDGSYRENLAALIGYTLFKKNYKERVKKETFEHIANLIVEVFPNERKETWFRLSDKVNYVGKLYNTYKNLRTKYTSLKAVIPHSDDVEDTDVIRQYKHLQLKNHFGLIVNLNLKTKEDLEDLILIENKAIMMKYQKDGELDSVYRDNLANVVVSSLMKKNEKVQRRDFEKLALLITKVFPNEDKDRWFALTPRTYSGKLFNTYRTYRSKYTQIGPFEPFEITGMYFIPVESGTSVVIDSVVNSYSVEKVPSTHSFFNTLETVTVMNEITENPIEFPSFDSSADPIGIKDEDAEIPKPIIQVQQNTFRESEPEPEEMEDDQESTSNYQNFELSSYEITELSTINSFVITHVNLDSVESLRTVVQNENKAVMIKYQNDGELDSLYRDNLTQLIILTLLKKNFRTKICRNTFHKIAKLIPQLFPTERRETYFGTNPKKFTGKLYNTYRTHRGKYASLGVLKDDANNTEKDLGVDIELPDDDGNRSLTSNIPLIVSCELETKDDLKNLIYIENKSILLKYKIDQELDNMYRETLTNLIIMTMMKKDHVEKIPRNVLQKLSSLIVQLFPNEKVETYFRAENRKFHGKLYSCYRTIRNKYMQLGAIKSYES